MQSTRGSRVRWRSVGPPGRTLCTSSIGGAGSSPNQWNQHLLWNVSGSPSLPSLHLDVPCKFLHLGRPDVGNTGTQRAHPRGRGEHYLWPGGASPMLGSSPRTRGTREHISAPPTAGGLIPPDAGTTRLQRTGGSRGWAHPRGRGEHRIRLLHRPRSVGSSPRTRGPPDPATAPAAQRGLIPADAGTTRAHLRSAYCWRAHPPGRGEHPTPAHRSIARKGSSPRTRGTPDPATAPSAQRGLIPADAGHKATLTGWC